MMRTYRVEFFAGYEPIIRFWEAADLTAVRERVTLYLDKWGGGEADIFNMAGDFMETVEVEG